MDELNRSIETWNTAIKKAVTEIENAAVAGFAAQYPDLNEAEADAAAAAARAWADSLLVELRGDTQLSSAKDASEHLGDLPDKIETMVELVELMPRLEPETASAVATAAAAVENAARVVAQEEETVDGPLFKIVRELAASAADAAAAADVIYKRKQEEIIRRGLASGGLSLEEMTAADLERYKQLKKRGEEEAEEYNRRMRLTPGARGESEKIQKRWAEQDDA